MMCSKLLKAENAHEKAGWLTRNLDRLFEGLKRRYQRRLGRTLNYRPVTLLVLAGVIAATGLMYMTSQRELAPEEDQGILFTLVKTPQYANLDYLEEATDQLNKVLSTVPEKDHVFAINGMGDVHTGFAGVLLKPWGERVRNHKAVLQELQPKISRVAGAGASVLAAVAAGVFGGPPVQFVITTTRDFRELADVLADVEKAARESGMFIFSDSASASRRRNSSSRSITTRPIGLASPWPISATRWPRCSAATTSICSTYTGGATRSFRRCRASSG